ncbi:MAG: phosphate signaling complex protein PhoU [Ruminiclostridium sp.]
MRTAFDEKLKGMNNSLIEMGTLIEEAISSSFKALKTGDRELAKKIMQGDKEVDRMEKAVESRALDIMLREQPVAVDLRKVTCALKIVTDMERIGDNAADIAEISLSGNLSEIFDKVKGIDKMTVKTLAMVNDAVTAFVERKTELAKEVVERDDEVDALFDEVKHQLIEMAKSDEATTDMIVDTLMVAKYLERISDHSVNICEWVEFLKTGEYKNTRII